MYQTKFLLSNNQQSTIREKTMALAKKQNNNRRFTGKGPRPDNREFRRREEAARVEKEGVLTTWQKLSPKEQLEALDARFGKGLGATRQRARIAAMLEKPRQAKSAETSAKTFETKKAKERRADEQAKRPAK